MEEETANVNMEHLIDTLHQVHCDNSRYQYYAELPGGRSRRSMMPITSFVHEFFLFNGLYQVNWQESLEQHNLIYHREGIREIEKREPFIRFIQDHVKQQPENFYRAFEPLIALEEIAGEWTKVVPDVRVSQADGDEFFRNICNIQCALNRCGTPEKCPVDDALLTTLKRGAAFVTSVRNNIFHGSKSLADVRGDQARRIEVYDLFLKALTSLFFLAMRKDRVACDFATSPVSVHALPITGDADVIRIQMVLEATHKGLMKVGDTRLISRFTRIVPPARSAIGLNKKSSLFYPSAGKDILTPLVLGLPYCTQFYFYDEARGANRMPPSRDPIREVLQNIRGIDRASVKTTQTNERFIYDFEFDGTPRRVNRILADNRTFLEEEVELAFYFHRGDSSGEGGSDQPWDSKWLPELLRKIPVHSSCLYLTDGVPHGFDQSYSAEVFELNVPFIERERRYYCGRFAPNRS